MSLPINAHLSSLVRDAKAGDEDAWRELVRRYDARLRATARSYRLNSADVDDVVQTTWVRAYRAIGKLQDPLAIQAWLTVTTRREAMHLLQRGVREVLTEEPPVAHRIDASPTEELALENARDTALREAVRRLTGRQRLVLRILLEQPGVQYAEIAALLGIPIGAIGPTRERALANLREDRVLLASVA